MIYAILGSVTYAIMGAPMYAIFRHGPLWMGCWQGKGDAEVCAELSNTDSRIWLLNNDACEDMIEKKFNSFYVVAGAAAYGYVFLNVTVVLKYTLWRLTH